jgi:DNA-binding NarL/FixJ family response regulator
MDNRIRVAVVDDHPLYRDGVVSALESEPDIEVVAQGETALEALHLARDKVPDILLLGVNEAWVGVNGIAKIAQQWPSTKIAVLAAMDDEDQVRSALKKGARGYLLKETSSSELISAIRLIGKGQSYVSSSLAARLITPRRADEGVATEAILGRFPELSHREEQVLDLLRQGLSNRLIGDKLGLTEKTIKGYVTVIMEKLQVTNRLEAAMMAAGRTARGQPMPPQDPGELC